jgi:hypothetical protein
MKWDRPMPAPKLFFQQPVNYQDWIESESAKERRDDALREAREAVAGVPEVQPVREEAEGGAGTGEGAM